MLGPSLPNPVCWNSMKTNRHGDNLQDAGNVPYGINALFKILQSVTVQLTGNDGYK